MGVYKLKDLAKRGAAFAAAVGLLSGIAMWAIPGLSFADALNPLTERTLLLSSSAPGYHSTDAAGNSGQYALPGSGPNGKKTGETFSFRVSTDSTATSRPIKAFTLQYCTTAAGQCKAPGDNVGTAPVSNDTPGMTTSDLNVVYPSASEVTAKPAVQATGGSLVATDDSDGNFGVYMNGTLKTGWTLTPSNKEEVSSGKTLQNNFITLTAADGSEISPAANDKIDLIFYATDNNYITNPGSGDFFVKINDFDTNTDADAGNPDVDGSALDPVFLMPDGSPNPHVIDGGVTVANVMTDSIQIQTKVLETMSFSVGTINPDLVNPTDTATGGHAGGTHGPCDAINVNDPINLGNPAAEYSLEVGTTWDAHSWWRLSSNSSNGASVYYSGYTLSNTENDQIDPAGTFDGNGFLTGNAVSHQGEEQFGLAFDQSPVTKDTNGGGASINPDTLAPLTPETTYADAAGAINGTTPDPTYGFGKFAFDPSSASTPALLAQEGTDVVGCTTGNMRYIGNIAAATPAGIYSSKVNYLAAPQY